jgi:hypothetical protein
VANRVACRRRARQCKLIARAVRSGEVRQALLDIAKAWAKLASEVDASEASEPRALSQRISAHPISEKRLIEPLPRLWAARNGFRFDARQLGCDEDEAALGPSLPDGSQFFF